ncbi:glutathione s-transferase-related protein-like protein [Stipitochalara longipes BDJ]|nr:glutathione s-transferase-related protein-like protein [Stipitochalara longipes BDJ]
MDSSREIIFYHYSFSPYARRITWYLNLRRIPYKQCMQPATMPRPDIASLGTAYRRIPLLSIGRDIYVDTRLILSKLETFFPPSTTHPSLSPSPSPTSSSLNSSSKTIEKLLEHWAIDAGMFNRAAALIPSDMPLLKDPNFTKDREDYNGRSWSREDVEKGRPEALVEVKGQFEFFEGVVLADGREWVLGGGDGPGLADIEAVWLFSWLKGLKGALPPDYISAQQFPKTFAWVERFDAVALAAMKKNGAAQKIPGAEALKAVGNGEWAEEEASVDEKDPSELKKGEMVEVCPIDSGFSRKDTGRLVGLSTSEVVIEVRTQEGAQVRIHAPRHGFRVRRTKESEKL